MDIKITLETILQYYATRRAVGHTHATLYGAVSNPHTVIIAPTHLEAMHLKSRLPPDGNLVISVEQLYYLVGRNSPVVFDNHTLVRLFQETLSYIELLEQQLKEKQAT